MWVLVLALCAGAGAYVASRTDPFPPGVEDPGARSPETRSSSPTPPPVTPIWKGRFTADTVHRLHVGGTCRSDWVAGFRVELRDEGRVAGEGLAQLQPATAGCDFDQAQVQADRIAFSLRGTWETVSSGTVLHLTFADIGLEPVGALDLGGFSDTIAKVRPVLRPRSDQSLDIEGEIEASSPDGNQGSRVAVYRFRAMCARGC